MKTAMNSMRYKIMMLVMLMLSTVYAFAQDVASSHSSETHSSTTTTGPDVTPDMWYNAPWVWIVGAGVVLLLLLLLIRGGSSSDSSRRVTRTTRTTTIRTE